MRYRPQARIFFFIWIVACAGRSAGAAAQEPDGPVDPGRRTWAVILIDYDINTVTWLSRIAALYYFGYFLVITPFLGLCETPLPVPDSLFTPVLSHPAGAPAGASAAPEKKG